MVIGVLIHEANKYRCELWKKEGGDDGGLGGWDKASSSLPKVNKEKKKSSVEKYPFEQPVLVSRGSLFDSIHSTYRAWFSFPFVRYCRGKRIKILRLIYDWNLYATSSVVCDQRTFNSLISVDNLGKQSQAQQSKRVVNDIASVV